jgi:hypothetical protein
MRIKCVKLACIQQVNRLSFASMNQISTEPEPKLAPPGAGVPWLERTIGGIFLKAQALRLSSGEASGVIELERQRIQDQLRPEAVVVAPGS